MAATVYIGPTRIDIQKFERHTLVGDTIVYGAERITRGHGHEHGGGAFREWRLLHSGEGLLAESRDALEAQKQWKNETEREVSNARARTGHTSCALSTSEPGDSDQKRKKKT